MALQSGPPAWRYAERRERIAPRRDNQDMLSACSAGLVIRAPSILLLAGLGTATTQQDQTGAHAAFQLVGAIGEVMLPALVLGIVVFKAFVRDRVFVTRSKVALLDPGDVLSRRDDHIFGYGSLMDEWSDPRSTAASVCALQGFRRTWNVSMDNSELIPGYKACEDPASGKRPAIFVTFLNLRPVPGAAVNGVMFPVDHGLLAVLDRRERNYSRVDVTDRVSPKVRGRVWAYMGTPEARDRYRRGLEQGTAVVSEAYLQRVHTSFERLGAHALTEFDRTTDRLEVPRRQLKRVDLPPSGDDRVARIA